MTWKLNRELAEQLTLAHRLVETIVLRTHAGTIFSIEIGESISSRLGPRFGAKITRIGPVRRVLAILTGNSQGDLFEQAQEFIRDSLEQPAHQHRPHLARTQRVDA